MDVTLDAVDGQNAPADTYVSMRVGAVQKQWRLGSQTRSYQFPESADGKIRNGRLEVFRRIGTVNVDFADFHGDQKEVEVICSDPVLQKLCMRVGMKGGGTYAPVSPERRKAKEAERKDDAKRYLEEHNLEQVLANAMRELIRDKPKDPVRFLSRHILSNCGMEEDVGVGVNLGGATGSASSQPQNATRDFVLGSDIGVATGSGVAQTQNATRDLILEQPHVFRPPEVSKPAEPPSLWQPEPPMVSAPNRPIVVAPEPPAMKPQEIQGPYSLEPQALFQPQRNAVRQEDATLPPISPIPGARAAAARGFDAGFSAGVGPPEQRDNKNWHQTSRLPPLTRDLPPSTMKHVSSAPSLAGVSQTNARAAARPPSALGNNLAEFIPDITPLRSSPNFRSPATQTPTAKSPTSYDSSVPVGLGPPLSVPSGIGPPPTSVKNQTQNGTRDLIFAPQKLSPTQPVAMRALAPVSKPESPSGDLIRNRWDVFYKVLGDLTQA